MADLFPTFPSPPLVEGAEEEDTPSYGTSWEFDFARGDFVLDGGGRVRPAEGSLAWAQWCVKAVLTERRNYLAYTADHGADLWEVRDVPDRQAREAALIRTITEALLADPRTGRVTDFEFAWEGDAAWVRFTIYPAVGTPERVEVRIDG